MKKENVLLIIAVLAYSYLFYQQWPGLNYLLFTVLLNALLFIKQPALLKNKHRWVFVAGSLISAAAIAYKESEIAVLTNLASITLLAVSALVNVSIISTMLHGAFSYLTSWNIVLRKWLAQRASVQNTESKTDSLFSKVLIIGVPVLITAFFFILYRSSSAVFNNYTKNINLDAIPFGLIFFTLFGTVLLLGIFYPRLFPFLHTEEAKLNLNIQEKTGNNLLFGREVKIETEYLSGVTLLIMLNLLVFSVNIVDILYFAFGIGEADISFSEAVHEGVGALILSILSAIFILVVYLRGSLNFYKKSKTFRLLAYIWVSQNILLVFTTAYKNELYISEYGLTYMRIGVYIYLLLATIGLITSLIKIAHQKTAWYLISKNAWTTYLVMVIGCVWNWDVIITKHNMHWAKENQKTLDVIYLSHLSNNNLSELLEISALIGNYGVSESDKEKFQKRLTRITEDFDWYYKNTGWQTKTCSDYKNYQYLKKHPQTN